MHRCLWCDHPIPGLAPIATPFCCTDCEAKYKRYGQDTRVVRNVKSLVPQVTRVYREVNLED